MCELTKCELRVKETNLKRPYTVWSHVSAFVRWMTTGQTGESRSVPLSRDGVWARAHEDHAGVRMPWTLATSKARTRGPRKG